MKRQTIALIAVLLGIVAGTAHAQLTVISMSVGPDGNVRILTNSNGRYAAQTLNPSSQTIVAASSLPQPSGWIPTQIATDPNNNTVVACEDTADEPAVVFEPLNSQDQETGQNDYAINRADSMNFGAPALLGFEIDPNGHYWIAQQQEGGAIGEQNEEFTVSEFSAINSLLPSSYFVLYGYDQGLNGFTVRAAPYELICGLPPYPFTSTTFYENSSIIYQTGAINGWEPTGVAAYSNGALAMMWQGNTGSGNQYAVWGMLYNATSIDYGPAYPVPGGGTVGPIAACPYFPAPLNLYFSVNLGSEFQIYELPANVNQATLLLTE